MAGLSITCPDFVLRIQTQNGTFVLKGLSAESTIFQLKKKISADIDLPVGSFRILYGYPPSALLEGNELLTLQEANIPSGVVLHIQQVTITSNAATGCGAASAATTSRAVASTATTSHAVASAATTSRAVASAATTSRSVASAATASRAVDSAATTSRAIDCAATTSRAVDSAATASLAVDSAATTSRAVDSAATTSRAVDSAATTGRAVDSAASTSRAATTSHAIASAATTSRSATTSHAVARAATTSSAIDLAATASGAVASAATSSHAVHSDATISRAETKPYRIYPFDQYLYKMCKEARLETELEDQHRRGLDNRSLLDKLKMMMSLKERNEKAQFTNERDQTSDLPKEAENLVRKWPDSYLLKKWIEENFPSFGKEDHSARMPDSGNQALPLELPVKVGESAITSSTPDITSEMIKKALSDLTELRRAGTIFPEGDHVHKSDVLKQSKVSAFSFNKGVGYKTFESDFAERSKTFARSSQKGGGYQTLDSDLRERAHASALSFHKGGEDQTLQSDFVDRCQAAAMMHEEQKTASEDVTLSQADEKMDAEETFSFDFSRSTHSLDGVMIRQSVPSNNSCLFTSVFYLLSNGDVQPQNINELRRIIAQVVASNPNQYNYAFLGMDNQAYCEWILNPEHWGGAIELAILSEHFNIELCAVDTVSCTMHRFGETRNFQNRAFLIYDGIHYDPLVLTNFDGGINTVFPVSHNLPVEMAMEVARECRSSRQFTDVANFTLRCMECNTHLRGENEARAHAMSTGHANYGEI